MIGPLADSGNLEIVTKPSNVDGRVVNDSLYVSENKVHDAILGKCPL